LHNKTAQQCVQRIGGGPRFTGWFKRKHHSVSLVGSPT